MRAWPAACRTWINGLRLRARREHLRTPQTPQASRRRFKPGGLLAGALLLGLVCEAGYAAEGMWTLDNLPVQAIKDRYGFAPDAPWTAKLMHGAVRLAGGCSGSFVSDKGLVLTNHHCVASCVEQLSTAKKDYIHDGFYAATAADERRCPEIELNRLEEITDVTARVQKATEGLSGKAYADAQKAEKARIESECAGADREKLRCDVVELYHGGRYALYRYHRFQDVRLVFAPEFAAAFFGGDPDNFNFPRYDLDMGLLRAYEDGKPAQIADYFPFSKNGAEEGEPVFVVGNPGATQRQLTMTQLARVRDVDTIPRLLQLAELRGVLEQYSKISPEDARIAQHDLFGVENSYKALYGRLLTLEDPAVLDAKRAQEQALKDYVAKDPALEAKLGGAWDAIGQAEAVYREIALPYTEIERERGFMSRYFEYARDLVRGADERGKPNPERLREFTDAALPSMTQELFSSAPIYPDYERLKLAWSLTKLREWLGTDDPFVKLVLGRESPDAVAAKLVAGTKLGSIAERKRLWDGGQAAIQASDDPFIRLARAVDPAARAVRKRYENEVKAVEDKSAEQIAEAVFARDGTSVYPDATFTLRLSYGEVRGWTEKGQPVPPFTDFAGAFAHATGFEPFVLPKSWYEVKDKLDLQQRLDFVTTNDIIGGNSGSPVVNRDAQLVGLIFDGNIHSLGGAFYYDETSNRAVAVDSSALLEALKTIYHAERIVDELNAAATSAKPVG